MKRFLLLATALHAADLVVTLVGLRMGFVEVGTVAAPALGVLGWTGLAFLPLIGLAVQAAVIRYLLPRRFLRAGYGVVLGVLCIPVVLNLSVVLA